MERPVPCSLYALSESAVSLEELNRAFDRSVASAPECRRGTPPTIGAPQSARRTSNGCLGVERYSSARFDLLRELTQATCKGQERHAEDHGVGPDKPPELRDVNVHGHYEQQDCDDDR